MSRDDELHSFGCSLKKQGKCWNHVWVQSKLWLFYTDNWGGIGVQQDDKQSQPPQSSIRKTGGGCRKVAFLFNPHFHPSFNNLRTDVNRIRVKQLKRLQELTFY